MIYQCSLSDKVNSQSSLATSKGQQPSPSLGEGVVDLIGHRRQALIQIQARANTLAALA